jgi:hypothetical protein
MRSHVPTMMHSLDALEGKELDEVEISSSVTVAVCIIYSAIILPEVARLT